jgi:KipI family sensor histidine kinase inhibitor
MTTNPLDEAPEFMIESLGDCGWLVQFPTETLAAEWSGWIRNQDMADVVEVVTAYRTAAVVCEPTLKDSAFDQLQTAIKQSVASLETGHSNAGSNHTSSGRLIHVPVVYDGPDLAEVAAAVGLTEAGVVNAHTSQSFHVYAVGFLPGFPYAGYLPKEISGLPRRTSPRTRVPAGSVAIAGRQTGIYPCESPGGWHLLGRTEMRICDLKTGFFQFQPGDRIQFVPCPGGVMPEDQETRHKQHA